VPFSRVLDLIERHQGIERAREKAQAFAGEARAIMSGFPDSPYRRALLAVTDLVTDRDR
jgi:geranylgeranyl pyrophosphate synthase